MIQQLQEGLQSSFGGIASDIRSFVQEKPITTALMAGGASITAGGIVAVTRKRKKTARKKAKKKRTKKGRKRDYKFRSKQKHELAYVRKKRKAGKKITRPRYKTKKSRRGIHYTKKGQPYKILANGRARFIKKTKRRKR